MIFSYSAASLQNSLSPGTKRHTKDGVRPLHVKHSLAWETHGRQATSRARSRGRWLPGRPATHPSRASLTPRSAHLPRRLPHDALSLPLQHHQEEMPTRKERESGAATERAGRQEEEGIQEVWRQTQTGNEPSSCVPIIPSEAPNSKSPGSRFCFHF